MAILHHDVSANGLLSVMCLALSQHHTALLLIYSIVGLSHVAPGSGTYSNTSIIKVPELGSTCTKDGSHAVYYFNPFAMLFPV